MTTDMLSWTRQQIETRKALAEEAHGASWALQDQLIERTDGGADDRAALLDAEDRTELVSVTLPGPGLDEDDLKHIAFNDPRQIIADCEADLGILDDHEPGWAGLKRDVRVCMACDVKRGDRWPCRTVRRIASRYRHRDGYLPEWAPEGTTP
ncbi:DUF6221 family protein [Nonomuraea purpurea]|uniref:DUF6221 family protein n=1 Tax=Nonomuraea purpurea TaxID=1849276 RepID=A0ABV8FY00_9ACTN